MSYVNLFVMKFDSKSSWFEVKSCFLKGFITNKGERWGGENAPPSKTLRCLQKISAALPWRSQKDEQIIAAGDI